MQKLCLRHVYNFLRHVLKLILQRRAIGSPLIVERMDLHHHVQSLQVNVYFQNPPETALTPFKTWTCHLGPYQAFTLLIDVSIQVDPAVFYNKCSSSLSKTPAVFTGLRYTYDGKTEEVIIVVTPYCNQ